MTQVTDFESESRAFHGYLRQVRIARGEARLEEAQRALDSALALADAMAFAPDLQDEAVATLWEVGRLEEAAQYLEHLAGLTFGSPGRDSRAKPRLAGAYIRLGRLREATAVLEEVLEEAGQGDGASLLYLGSALRYRGELDGARPYLKEAYRLAEKERDGGLAVAALFAQGELELDAGNHKDAVILFGKAYGLTEFSAGKSLSVLPLAGLGQAQGAWGYPLKGLEVAGKALRRAEQQGDKIGLARAFLAVGITGKEAGSLYRAIREADAAPHLPLTLKAFVALAEVAPGSVNLEEAISAAKRTGMSLDVRRLETIAGKRGHSDHA